MMTVEAHNRRPNWLMRTFLGISIGVHVLIIQYGSGPFHPEISLPIELTILHIEPPKPLPAETPLRSLPPEEPQQVSHLTALQAPAATAAPVKAASVRPTFPRKMKKTASKPKPLSLPEPMDSGCAPKSLQETDSNPDLSAAMSSGSKIPESAQGKEVKKPVVHSDESDSLVREQYLNSIRRLIERHKKYPQVAKLRQFQGRVVVEFVLTPSGDVKSICVVQGCRFEILDRAAIRAVEDASPFPKPPDGLFSGNHSLRIPIVFELS